MLRLSDPAFTFEETLNDCMAGITGNAALAIKLELAKSSLLARGIDYVAAASNNELHTIAPIEATINPDPVAIETLTKSDLVKVYDNYFVSQDKPARRIYNALLNAAEERCPFCGGIGTPRNLDHFLPKAHFPQFSVLPINLVPACRDCNMDGKGHDFAINAEEQIIQPYVDKARFFQDQWIFAIYHAEESGEPGNFEYFVHAPHEWPEVDKKRARKHFLNFDLARRYATQAAQFTATVLKQIAAMQAVGLRSEEINTALLTPGVHEAPFANHWQRGMYQALMNWVARD